MRGDADRGNTMMRSGKWLWGGLAAVIAILAILVWRDLVSLNIASTFLTLLGVSLGILTETDHKEENGTRKVTRWGYALLVVTVAAGIVSSRSAYREEVEKKKIQKQSETDQQENSKKLANIESSQKTAEASQQKAEGEAQTAEAELKQQIDISKSLALELGTVRHELDLARLPVNRVRLRWDVTIPVTTTCLKAYVEDQAGKHAKTKYFGLIISPNKNDFPGFCLDELAGLFKRISLNGVLVKRGLDIGPEYLDLITYLPKGGTRNDFFRGSVPDGIWPFNVSGTALDSPERPISYDEKTNLLYLSFDTIPEDTELRTPSGKALSVLDASEGMFLFTVELSSYISPYVPNVVPTLSHVRVELNNWAFEFRERNASYTRAEPFLKEERSDPLHSYYWGRAPKFKTQLGLPPTLPFRAQ
jgi:hypothetical protein